MAKRAENVFYTEGFAGLSACDEMHVCSAEPTSYADVVTKSLGSVAMVPGDFVESAGSPDGRKVTVGAKTITGTGNGTGTHLALRRTDPEHYFYATTCTSVGITDTVPQDFGAWAVTVRAPV
jgi:hypothetical protein